MPQPKNTLARLLIPAAAILIGLGISAAFFANSKPAPSKVNPVAVLPASGAHNPATSGTAPAGAPAAADAPSVPAAVPTQAAAQPSAPAPTGLRPRVFEPAAAIDTVTIGSLDKAGTLLQQVRMSRVGAGFASVKLSHHFESIKETQQVEVQAEHLFKPQVTTPFAALWIEVGAPGSAQRQRVTLFYDAAGLIWRAVPGKPAGTFEAFVDDGANAPVLRIERTVELTPGAYEIVLRQTVENLSAAPLEVVWAQLGPVDLPQDSASYGGDKRRVRFGYLLPPSYDPKRQSVVSDAYSLARAKLLGTTALAESPQWPTEKSAAAQHELSWVGLTNRYYATAVYPVFDPAAAKPDKAFGWVDRITRDWLGPAGGEVVGLRLYSKPRAIAPGAKADFSAATYAGPMDKRALKTEARPASLRLDKLPYYNFGGMCAFCTFEFLTSFLLWLLTAVHSIVGDWAIAIMVLVVVVRTCLHPLTKSTQIRMARFGKQMAGMAPKQKLIQEKYKDDPRKLQEEMGKLWREEGVSPLGMLGCLPTFLQTPVWIALSATLYFAVELRHQGAFYGVFQAIQPATSPLWNFLGDLAEPDRLVYFGRTVFTAPMLGPIESVNIMPLILGVVFFIQQKYLKPPTTTALTPDQEFQQKLTQWMMVIMFPLMMYNAPSGLALYFLVNSTLGIFEARYIRSHMDKYDLLNTDKLKAKKAAGGGGFMARLQQMAEQKRQDIERRSKNPKAK
ncbi:MAG: YidC/Oxa1 family insertase periplasmic-domain containing protein [Phycisphaerales bacterium]